MPWTKLSDDFPDECWTLSDRAFRLHVEGTVWSNRKMLDSRIPFDDLPRFARHPESVNELLQTGWWAQADTYYVIRHHAIYQRTREQVLAQQEANVKNGMKGGRPTKPKPPKETQSLTEPLTDSPSETETKGDRTGTGHLGRGDLKEHEQNCKCRDCKRERNLASWGRPA